MVSNYSHHWRRADVLSVEASNHEFKNTQVKIKLKAIEGPGMSGRYETPDYKNMSKRPSTSS